MSQRRPHNVATTIRSHLPHGIKQQHLRSTGHRLALPSGHWLVLGHWGNPLLIAFYAHAFEFCHFHRKLRLADLRSQPVQLGRSRAMVHQMRKSCRRGVPEKSRAEGSGKSNLPDLRRLLARLTVCRARPSLVSVGIGTGVGKD
ncbi:hypothetical protein RRG08_025621 [Elysia crispata]|uniref:Uncharacterized protein n=1 Tax=Elysia crispata TaxID=231223 RepID=A0AAE1CX16_9GAST|nr:hypothetical protein RRG08_025621 [Elysia crispata]